MAVNKKLPLETVLSRVMPGQNIRAYIYEPYSTWIIDKAEFQWPHYDAEWWKKYRKGDVTGLNIMDDYSLEVKADAPEGGKK